MAGTYKYGGLLTAQKTWTHNHLLKLAEEWCDRDYRFEQLLYLLYQFALHALLLVATIENCVHAL